MVLLKLPKKEIIEHRLIHANICLRDTMKHLEGSKFRHGQDTSKHNFKDESKSQGALDDESANVETDYIAT